MSAALWCAYGPGQEMQGVIGRRGEGTPPYGDFYREAVRIPLRFVPTKNQKAGDLQTKSSALFGRKINEKVLLTVPSIAAGY